MSCLTWLHLTRWGIGPGSSSGLLELVQPIIRDVYQSTIYRSLEHTVFSYNKITKIVEAEYQSGIVLPSAHLNSDKKKEFKVFDQKKTTYSTAN